MSQLLLDVPEGALKALTSSANGAGPELLMAAAVKLYELGRLSSGAAAELAGVPRVEFLQRLSDYGVDTFRLNEAELAREVRLG